jgi:peptidoglycan/xylan/chitin deacetylase (PgdA/CDA1 family)
VRLSRSAAFFLGAAVGAWCAPAAAPVAPELAATFGIPLRLPRGRGLALTFDDGPHPEGTPAVLEQLDRAGVRATFYLVGEQVERHPALAAEIAAAGHEIGIHGYRHILLLRRTPGALRDDLARAADVIGEATGRESLSYRPPYGVFSLAGLRLARERWTPLLWSHWGRDWEARATPSSIAALATRRLGPGAVVLLHDSDAYSAPASWRQTSAALPAVLEASLATGEPLVTASQST